MVAGSGLLKPASSRDLHCLGMHLLFFVRAGCGASTSMVVIYAADE
jgi:hypothetical protein